MDLPRDWPALLGIVVIGMLGVLTVTMVFLIGIVWRIKRIKNDKVAQRNSRLAQRLQASVPHPIVHPPDLARRLQFDAPRASRWIVGSQWTIHPEVDHTWVYPRIPLANL